MDMSLGEFIFDVLFQNFELGFGKIVYGAEDGLGAVLERNGVV